MKKRFKEWRDSLTIAKAAGISIGISLLFLLIYVAIMYLIKIDVAIELKFTIAYCLFFVILFACFKFFKIDEKSRKRKNLKAKANFPLREDEYIEVFRRSESYHQESESAWMDFSISQKEGCRYFVKLLPKDEYHLIVEDRNEEIVYEVTLGNWFFLNEIFEV